MRTKYIIVLSVVALVLVGFIGYRSSKKKSELGEYQEKTNSMLVEIARNSPTGGMAQMGMALNSYAKDRGGYPESLQKLHPKYINSKAFIEEIPWEYEPKGDDFSLKKSFTRDNKRIVASLDKTLKPSFETPFMVASVGGLSKTKTATPKQPDAGKVSKPGISGKVQVALSTAAPAQDSSGKPVSDDLERMPEEEKYVPPPLPGAFTIVEVETCTGFPVEVSQRHLVWREKAGIMGFGNVEYPDDERLTICANGQWVDVKRVRQKSDESEESQHVSHEPRRTLFGVAIR